MEPMEAALAGGAVAIVGTAVSVYGAHIAAGRRRNRDDLRNGASDFLAACDQLWRAGCAIRLAVFKMTYVDSRDRASGEVTARADYDRLRAFEEHGEASWKARRARDTITLLAPTLQHDADGLYASCDLGQGVPQDGPLPSQPETERRQSARDAFMRSAGMPLR